MESLKILEGCTIPNSLFKAFKMEKIGLETLSEQVYINEFVVQTVDLLLT